MASEIDLIIRIKKRVDCFSIGTKTILFVVTGERMRQKPRGLADQEGLVNHSARYELIDGLPSRVVPVDHESRRCLGGLDDVSSLRWCRDEIGSQLIDRDSR